MIPNLHLSFRFQMHHNFHPSHIKEEMKTAPYRDHEHCSKSASNERLIFSLTRSLQASTAWFLPSSPISLLWGCRQLCQCCRPVFTCCVWLLHLLQWLDGGRVWGAAMPHFSWLVFWCLNCADAYKGGHLVLGVFAVFSSLGFLSGWWPGVAGAPHLAKRSWGQEASSSRGAQTTLYWGGRSKESQHRKVRIALREHRRERQILHGSRRFHRDCSQEQEEPLAPPLGAPSLPPLGAAMGAPALPASELLQTAWVQPAE